MDCEIFTVYDSAAKRYLDIFSAPSKEFAIREFKFAVNRDGHQFNIYPTDFTLFYIGQFDAETGKITGQEPVSLGVGITFVETLDIGAQA